MVDIRIVIRIQFFVTAIAYRHILPGQFFQFLHLFCSDPNYRKGGGKPFQSAARLIKAIAILFRHPGYRKYLAAFLIYQPVLLKFRQGALYRASAYP